MVNDTYRLLLANGNTIAVNPRQLYTSVWPMIPYKSSLYTLLSQSPLNQNCVRTVIGGERSWTAELATLTCNTFGVTCIAYSPDGNLLVSGSIDGIRLWDINSGRCTFDNNQCCLHAAFSVDGKQIAYCSGDPTIGLLDVASGMSTASLQSHTEVILSVAFAPDNQRLASGSADNTIRLWDVTSGMCTATLLGHTDRVNFVTFSPITGQLASASGDFTVRLWDVTSGRCITVLDSHTHSVQSVAFSPHGTQLASASFDETVRLWDLTSGNCMMTLQCNSSVNSVCFSPKGNTLVSGLSDKTIHIWDVVSGVCTAILGRHAVESVAISPNGNQLASGGGTAVRLWDITSQYPPKPHDGGITAVSFSPNGRKLASASGQGVIRLWDVASGTCTATLEGHPKKPITFTISLAFSPNGDQLASASAGDAIRLWDTTSGKCIITFEGNISYPFITFSPDSKQVASFYPYQVIGIAHHIIGIWDVVSGKCVTTLIYGGSGRPLSSFVFSPDSKQLVSWYADPITLRTVRLWDIASGTSEPLPDSAEQQISSSRFLVNAADYSNASVSPVMIPVEHLERIDATGFAVISTYLHRCVATGQPLA